MLKDELKKMQQANVAAGITSEKTASKNMDALLDKHMKDWAEHIIGTIAKDAKRKLNNPDNYKYEVIQTLFGKTIVRGNVRFQNYRGTDSRYRIHPDKNVNEYASRAFQADRFTTDIEYMYHDVGYIAAPVGIILVYIGVKPILFTRRHIGGYYGKQLLSYLLPMAKENGISLRIYGRRYRDEGWIRYFIDVGYTIKF